MYLYLLMIPLYGEHFNYFKYLFIIGLITLALVLMLRSILLVIIQAVIIFGLVMIGQMDHAALAVGLAIIQIAFTLWMIYKLKLAIDYSYRLVLEKTHLAKREITETDYTGSRKSF